MNPLLSILIASALYMAAGACREFIVVCYYHKVAERKPYSASGLAGGIELFDLLILAAIFRSGFNPALMVAYTVGVMIGTFIGARPSK
jgi:hypothetical protein